MLNNITIAGNLTRDAELRGGRDNMFATFAVAHNEWHGKDKPETTLFLNCVLFGNRAESLANYLVRGSKVCISGRLASDDYENKDGVTVHAVQLIVSDIELMTQRERDDERNDGGYSRRR